MNIFPSYHDVGFNPNDWTNELLEKEGSVEAGDYFNYWMTNWFSSSLSTAPPLDSDFTSLADGSRPFLPVPGETTTGGGTSITDTNTENLLSFLQYQDHFSEQEIVLYVHQYVSSNASNGTDPELLVGKALGELMQTSLQIEPNHDLENLWYSTRSDLIQTLHPSSRLVLEAMSQHFRNEGLSEVDANKLAEKAMVKLLDSQLEKMGGIVPSYGFGPKVADGVAGMFSFLLAGAQNPAALTTLFTDLGNMEANLTNFMEGIPNTGTAALGQTDLALFKTNATQFADGMEEMIDGLITTLKGSNLPEDTKASFLEVMGFILEMLSMIKALIVQLAIQDVAQGKSEAQSSIDFALARANEALDSAKRSMEAIKDAQDKKDKAESKQNTLQIVQIVIFVVIVAVVVIVAIVIIAIVLIILVVFILILIVIVIAMILLVILCIILGALLLAVVMAVVTVVIAVVAVVFAALAAIVAAVIIIGVLAMAALIIGAAVTLFALNQTGELSKVYDGLFALIMAIFRELFGSDMEVQNIAWVVLGIIAAIVLIVFLAILLIVVLAIVLLAAVFVVAVVVMFATAFIGCFWVLVVALIAALVIAVVAIVLCIILILVFMILLSLAIPLIPELLLRAGFAQLLAKWLGPIVGMKEDDLTLALEFLFSIAAGGDTMMLTQGERNAKADTDLVKAGAGDMNYDLHKMRATLAMEDVARLSSINLASSFQTGLERAKEERTEEKHLQLLNMLNMLKKMVHHLEEVLKRMLGGGGGGSPGEISTLVEEVQAVATQWTQMVDPAAQLPDFRELYEALFGFLMSQMAQNMPSKEMIDQMKSVINDNQFRAFDINERNPKVTVPV